MKVHYHAFFSSKAFSNCFDTVLMKYSHFKVKHKSVQKSYFYLKRVQKNFDQKIFFL